MVIQMSAKMKSIFDRLCGDMIVEAHDNCIITPMYYPNGDSINLFFRISGNVVHVSDEGATLDVLANATPHTPQLSADRRKTIDMICDRIGVQFSGKKFSRVLRAKSFNADCFEFCQTIATVTGLYYQQEQHSRSQLPQDVEQLLDKKVRPKRSFVKHWKDSTLDPNGSFPVDYHFNGQMPVQSVLHYVG